VWWDPANAGEQWIGTLLFDAREAATLTITVPTARANPFPPLETYERILGLTTSGVAITLLNNIPHQYAPADLAHLQIR
jgi:hypothetical protein